MIDELLLFTRARRGVIETEVRCVDAVELAQEALAVVQHEADSSKIELCRQFPPGPVEIHTDPDKVVQVLVNFLGNALKFTRAGRVGLRLRHDHRGVVYEVWDTGPGVAREHRERIFEEFTQLETATNGRKGTGLGLAISASFAEMVGGKVELDSWVGRGSVFRLVLPSGGGWADGHTGQDPTPRAWSQTGDLAQPLQHVVAGRRRLPHTAAVERRFGRPDEHQGGRLCHSAVPSQVASRR
jgi:signal transduction histidine kinase